VTNPWGFPDLAREKFQLFRRRNLLHHTLCSLSPNSGPAHLGHIFRGAQGGVSEPRKIVYPTHSNTFSKSLEGTGCAAPRQGPQPQVPIFSGLAHLHIFPRAQGVCALEGRGRLAPVSDFPSPLTLQKGGGQAHLDLEARTPCALFRPFFWPTRASTP
jgi:hypothetical protein